MEKLLCQVCGSEEMLYENGIFRYYIGLRRNPEAGEFEFDVFDASESSVYAV